jgi:CRISPR-associated exonuclease Cas4
MPEHLQELLEDDAAAALDSNLEPPPLGPVITVTDLRQWTYCPRVVYYTSSLGLRRRPVTFKMQEGRQREDEALALERRRTLARYGLHEGTRHIGVVLSSARLGLRGRVDLVIVTSSCLAVVEFKDTPRRPARNHAVQLCAYALLAEERWGLPCPRAFVHSPQTGRTYSIPLSQELRTATLEAITTVRALVAAERFPPPTLHLGRCRECEFRPLCNDRDL